MRSQSCPGLILKPLSFNLPFFPNNSSNPAPPAGPSPPAAGNQGATKNFVNQPKSTTTFVTVHVINVHVLCFILPYQHFLYLAQHSLAFSTDRCSEGDDREESQYLDRGTNTK